MKKRSTALIIATVLSTVYAIYLFCYFIGGTASSNDAAEAIGGAIATALVTPHASLFLIGAIFGWLGVFLKKAWAALVAAILYAVGMFLFMVYIMFAAPIMILGFIGFANQSKLNKKAIPKSTEE